MRILIISAYEANSHKAWANALMSGLEQHDWQYISLPARHFAWRIRGNAMSFAFDPKFKDALQKPYDLVIATSMTDCVGLKAFCPDLQNIPWILYFHENQFAYPAGDNQQGLIEMQMVTLYSALAADLCVFNSAFNQTSFFQGAKALLKKLPDYVSPDWLMTTETNSQVIPVPIEWPSRTLLQRSFGVDRQADISIEASKLKIAWSARWEFDKGPERLFAILQALEATDLEYEIAIMGEQFRTVPEVFSQIKLQFSHRITQFGYAESRDQYFAILASSDLFLSTALHEFQGLSVLEAVAVGCVPVLPNRQVYPELFDEECLYQSHLNDLEKEASSATKLIQSYAQYPIKPPSVTRFCLENVLAGYREIIQKFES
ncbi:tRNA-queuosine alpha-mannosyltransferase domain-containing protein [Marinomonas sp. TW1]|uniref:tRNA-queuosine alpha-mannosyltransferase domain-containing protein n=1 Tax=Marinomonas sp. TW1 TaxID=1561203 RepID=UPI0007AF9581|nr:DUF3524 domain-containing protein [Marinomonas sp. TW1]KZN15298.1 glycosyl transferase family 1 [Marinomonas sp. TW1]